MSALLLVAAALAALNPPARAVRLRDLDRRRLVAAGLVAWAVVAVLAAVADPLLDAADVSAPTARVGAGLVLVLAGLLDLVRRHRPEPEVSLGGDGWWTAAVPVAFPLLLEPQVGVMALAGGADRGVVDVVACSALALVLVAIAHRLPPPLLAPLARLVGALGVLAGTALVADGVLSV